MKNNSYRPLASCLMALGLLATVSPVRGEVMLQFFNNTWNEIADKIPELAEVGYWRSGCRRRRRQRRACRSATICGIRSTSAARTERTGGRTRYGTEEELLRLIETAHRFGMRVYFDNIMNHRAFDVPGYNENTPIDIYPGMLPEDFHLRVTEEGFYRKWNNTENWGNTWQVQNQNLSDLIDIAHETPNGNFGPAEGNTHPKIWFVRHPNHPEYYDYHPTLGYVGFYSTNITTNMIAQNPDFYKEDVGGYLMRSIRWLVDHTKVDGLRLDAVKHVPAYFFGEQWARGQGFQQRGLLRPGPVAVQQDARLQRRDNHRDTVFDIEQPRPQRLMMFGEHMGEPPPYGDYWAAGMRLLDARTHSTMNNLAWLEPWGCSTPRTTSPACRWARPWACTTPRATTTTSPTARNCTTPST